MKKYEEMYERARNEDCQKKLGLLLLPIRNNNVAITIGFYDSENSEKKGGIDTRSISLSNNISVTQELLRDLSKRFKD